MWKSLAVLLVVLAANGCATVVRCGVGTLAVPDGVDPDGPGFFVSQDGDDYVDGDGDRYEEVTCRPVTPVTLCGARTQAKAAVPGDEVNPDGGGFFVNQDGGGFFVNQDDSVPAQQVCVAAEPA